MRRILLFAVLCGVAACKSNPPPPPPPPGGVNIRFPGGAVQTGSPGPAVLVDVPPPPPGAAPGR